jgi:hypothetical protein
MSSKSSRLSVPVTPSPTAPVGDGGDDVALEVAYGGGGGGLGHGARVAAVSPPPLDPPPGL